jgi:mono/diheme cytochrome c family protein
MKTLLMTARNLATIIVLTLLVVASARGETGTVLSANVPFAFEAGGTSLPAGTYQFTFHSRDQSIVISGANTGEIKLHVISQLAGASLFKDTGLVFDAYQGHHVLSEVWIPGEGGALVNATPKEHPHEMVIAMVSGAAPKLSGKQVFERTCARCHGPQGKGNPAADKFFKTSIPRLDSKYVQSKSDQELMDIISHGKGNMDPVRIGQASMQHVLYPELVGEVITYIRTFKVQ